MDYSYLCVLVSILIIIFLFINHKIVPLKQKNNINKLESSNNLNIKNELLRYEQSLIENFNVDVDDIEDDIGNNQINESNKINISNSEIANKITEAIEIESNTAEELLNKKNNVSNQKASNQKESNVKASNENIILNSVNKNNAMISDKFIVEDDNIFDMMKKLDDVEIMCSKLDTEQKIKDDLQQINLNKTALQELDNQEIKINELGKIVKNLRTEKERRDNITRNCQHHRSESVSNSFNDVTKLASKGFLKDERYKVALKLPENGIQFDTSNIPNIKEYKKLKEKEKLLERSSHRSSYKKKCNKKYKGFDLKKLDGGVCHGCNSNVLKKDINRIRKDFK